MSRSVHATTYESSDIISVNTLRCYDAKDVTILRRLRITDVTMFYDVTLLQCYDIKMILRVTMLRSYDVTVLRCLILGSILCYDVTTACGLPLCTERNEALFRYYQNTL